MDELSLFGKIDLRKYKKILSILLFVLAFILYCSAINNELVNYDDDWLITDNIVIKSLSSKNIYKIFSGPTGTDYLPLKELSYALDYKLFSNKPYGYHLTNVIIYSFTSVLVFLLLCQISGGISFSLIVSLLYIFHPVHAEVVNWASSRKDCLSGLFFFASMLFYSKFFINGNKGKPYNYLLSVLFFLCSLLSKPSGVVLPFLLFLMEYCFYDKTKREFVASKIFIKLSPFVFMAVSITVLTLATAVQKDVVKEFWMDSPYITFLAMITVVADYVRILFLPVNLNVRYNVDLPTEFFNPSVILSVVFLFIISISIVIRRKDKWYFFGFLWFFISLLPVSNIIPIAILKADRYLYLPSLGMTVVIGVVLCNLCNMKSGIFSLSSMKKITIALTLIILIFFSFLVQKRNKQWVNSKTLWKDTLKKSSDDYLVMNNLGSIYVKDGDYDSAEKLFEKAIRIDPGYSEPYFNLSTIYEDRNDMERALLFINKAIELTPDNFKFRVNRGNIYRTKGVNGKAEEEYKEAIKIKPHSPEGYYNLAMLYKSINLKDKAYMLYNKAIEMDETFYQAYNNLGNIFFEQKDLSKAEFYFGKAVKLNPEYIEGLNNLATIYIETGKAEQGINLLKRALELDNKKYRDILYHNLYRAYITIGDKNEALRYLLPSNNK